MSSANQYQIDPSTHPADAAMAREASGGPAGSSLTPQELAHYSQMNPADLVSQLANANVEVPRDSPLHKMSSDQLRAEMTKGMKAISDLRNSQQSISRLESRVASSNDVRGLVGFPAFDSQGNVILDGTGSEFERAERSIDQSRKSAAAAGLRDLEYNQALEQLQATAPNARPQPAADPNEPPATITPSGVPYQIEKGANGDYTVTLDTNERFRGTADEVIEKLAHSKYKTSVWGRGLNAELKQLRGQTPSAAVPETPQPGWDALGTLPDESSRFLVENAAKVLGYNSADELINHQLERDQKLANVAEKLEQYENDIIIQDFLSQAPDYPDTKQAAEAIDKIISASGLEWNADNMALAHAHAVRKGFYQPLRPEEVEASYQPQMRQNSGPRVPPRPPDGNAPGGNENLNPWSMPKDELRRKVLEGGGLGKALLDMKPGETFGI